MSKQFFTAVLDQRQVEEQNRGAEKNLDEEWKSREEKREREQEEVLEREQKEVEKLNKEVVIYYFDF